MSSSGNTPNTGGSKSNPSHRRRSTRNFGPSAAADGKAYASRQTKSDRSQASVDKDRRIDQSAGSDQRSRKSTSNQRQGNSPGGKKNPQSVTARSGQQPRRPNQPQRRPQQSKSQQTQGGRSPAEPRAKTAPRQQAEAEAQRPAAQKVQNRSRGQAQKQRVNRWEKQIKAEETLEDIKRENDRIEKEIWLEIAGIHTIKLDL